jgi:hypothetical protein
VSETVRGFSEILEGKHDDLPEQAFYMVGTIDEAREQGEQMMKKAPSDKAPAQGEQAKKNTPK